MYKNEITEAVTNLDNIVSVTGPVVLNKCKIINFQKFNEIEDEVKKEKWEAVMLINKCIEHTMRYERELRKSKDEMTEEEQYLIKEDFYKKYLFSLGEEKSTRLINLIDSMIFNNELDKFGGETSENISIS